MTINYDKVDRIMVRVSVALVAVCAVMAVVCIFNDWWLLLASFVISGAASLLNAKTARTNVQTVATLRRVGIK